MCFLFIIYSFQDKIVILLSIPVLVCDGLIYVTQFEFLYKKSLKQLYHKISLRIPAVIYFQFDQCLHLILIDDLESLMLMYTKYWVSGESQLLQIGLQKQIFIPRHIEIQIIGDKYGKIFHLSKRNCFIQIKNKKLYLGT